MKIRSAIEGLNSPGRITVFTALLYGLYILIYLWVNQFNMSSFIWFGDDYIDREKVPLSCLEKVSQTGYDGQFFYRLSLEPFTVQAEKFGISFDTPAYRQQRILYPLISWILSFGNPEAAVFTMVVTNFCAICAIGFFAAKILENQNRNIACAVLIVLYPGLVISLSRGLSEPLAIGLMVISVYLLLRNQPVAATAALSLAVLARETTLLFAVAAGIYRLFHWFKKDATKCRTKIQWYYFVVPALVYIGWQVYLFSQWKLFPVHAGQVSNISIPFWGIIESVQEFFTFENPDHYIYLSEFSWMVIFTCVVAGHLHGIPGYLKTAWLLYGIMALTMTYGVWSNHPSFYRACSEFNIIGIIVLVISASRFKYYCIPVWGFFWFLAAFAEIYIQWMIPS